MTNKNLRDTYAMKGSLQYRLRAAGNLLGVTDNTMRGYADASGIVIKRYSDTNPSAPSVRLFDPETLFRLAQWRRERGYTKVPAADTGPVVITVSVIKGGTGKTTTAVELAIHLQLLGMRTLLIDVDIQANATQMMGYEPDLTLDEAEAYELTPEAIVTDTFASLLIPYLDRLRMPAGRGKIEQKPISIKKPFGEVGPHLIPADTYLGDVEQAIALAKGHRELYIRNLISESRNGTVPGFNAGDYDAIIFDCPPSASFTSTGALAAADFVVVPIRLDAFSIKGLSKLLLEIDGLDKAYHHKPNVTILPTHYSPHLARIGRMQIKLDQYRDMLAPNAISTSEDFPRSLENYLPLTLQKPSSMGAKEYRMFAEYMMTKILSASTAKQRPQ